MAKTDFSSKRRNPIAMALEPRVLLDGAALVDAAQAIDAASVDTATDTTQDQVIIPQAVEPARDARREIAFVDTTVTDYQTLADGVGDGIEVFLISSFDEMQSALAEQSELDAIHILSHGADGQITVGGDLLSIDTLSNYSDLIDSIQQSMTENGDLMLYGCNVASDGTGQAFIDALAEQTQADVAASSDATGAADQGGDWVLEVNSGAIETDEVVVDTYAHELITADYTNSYTASTSLSFSGSAFRHGDSYIQLANSTDQAGAMLDNNWSFAKTNTTEITFDSYAHGGSSDSYPEGGDGFVMYFVDANRSTVTAGSIGGYYGYTNMYFNGDSGYAPLLGIAYNNINAQQGVASVHLLNTSGTKISSATVDLPYQAAWSGSKVVINNGSLSLYFDSANDGTYETTVFSNVDVSSYLTATNIKTGFTAGTGGAWNYYDVDNFVGATNSAPTNQATIADQSLSEDFSDYTIDLKSYFQDAETADASLTYTYSGNSNIGVSISSGVATISSATDNWSGSETIRFTVADPDGYSVYQDVVFTVSAVNDAPAFTNLDGDSLTYTEGDGAVTIDQSTALGLSDIDSTDFSSGALTVTISSGEAASEDKLSFATSGTVSLAGTSAGDNVSVGGVVVGTLANNIAAGNDLVVNLNSSATAARIQTLAQAITYENIQTSNPTDGARTVRVTVSDGDGATSANQDVTVNVVQNINEAPVFSTSSSFTVNENTTAVGTVTASDTQTNKALVFDGSDDYVALSGLGVSTSAGAKTTVEFWMNWDGTSNMMPFGFGQYDLWLQGGSFGYNTGVTDIYGISSSGLANQWVHVAAVFTNGDVSANELYINGVQQVLSKRLTNNYDNTKATVATSARIGSWTYSNSFYFDGQLNDVRIWSDERSSSEISNNMNTDLVGNEDNLVAYYKMDETSGTTVTNSVSGGTNGTFNGNTSVTSANQSGSSISYSIVSGGDGASFSINSSTGVLAFSSAPNYESKSSYTLTVRATDGTSGLTSDQTITVTVADVNDAPTAANKTITINEDTRLR